MSAPRSDMIRRLRRQFVVTVTGAALVILAAVILALFLFTRSGVQRQSEALLEQALNGGVREGFPDRKPGFGFARGEDGGRRSLAFTVRVEGDGDVEWESRAWALLDDLDEDELEELARQAAAAPGESGSLEEYSLRYLKRQAEDGTLIAFADTSQERDSMHELLKNALLVGAAALALVFLASIFLARRAVRPVEEAWTRQRQFVGDASHELKTPLTVILSNADMILSHPGADAARWAGNIKAEGDRMKDLVQQLLALARSDDGAASPVFETVDLSALLADEALTFEPLAFESGHELLYDDVAPGVFLAGDRAGLTQLCGILLDNACKYASPGGRIWVSLRPAGKSARLTVANEGEPIAPEDLSRIFQRFYRADPSRHGEGHGLGLAIASRVVEQHKGRVWAESAGGRNSFIVTLPVK